VVDRLADGNASFYGTDGLDLPYITLSRDTTPVMVENNGAAIRDIGDGVLCLEFRTEGNVLNQDAVKMLNAALCELESGWNGLVIGNRGKLFSGGTDLSDILRSIDGKAWDKIERDLKILQEATSSLKYAASPVVTAPFGLTLGGGAEIAMHSHALTPAVGTRIGLVEAHAGLVPGAGGCKEMLAWAAERAAGISKTDLLPVVKSVWRLIAHATVSTNAFDAIGKGFIKPDTRVVMNIDAIINKAKAKVLELTRAGFMPPVPKKLPLLGDYGYAEIKFELQTMRNESRISSHDFLVADKLAFVLTGGAVVSNTFADENHILELEREAFLSLCGHEKTRKRIEHMLKTGKPLRN